MKGQIRILVLVTSLLLGILFPFVVHADNPVPVSTPTPGLPLQDRELEEALTLRCAPW